MAGATADDILSGHAPEIRNLAQRLRVIVAAAAPPAAETVYPGWHGFFGYRNPRAGYFCGIFPQRNCVKLGFEFGYLLPDPYALLEGDGKRLRYVVLEKGDRIPVDSIEELIGTSLVINDR